MIGRAGPNGLRGLVFRHLPPVRAGAEAVGALDRSDGLCGVCGTRYLEGEIEHRDYVLSKEQRRSKMILCCSRAKAPGGTIVLDL